MCDVSRSELQVVVGRPQHGQVFHLVLYVILKGVYTVGKMTIIASILEEICIIYNESAASLILVCIPAVHVDVSAYSVWFTRTWHNSALRKIIMLSDFLKFRNVHQEEMTFAQTFILCGENNCSVISYNWQIHCAIIKLIIIVAKLQ